MSRVEESTKDKMNVFWGKQFRRRPYDTDSFF